MPMCIDVWVHSFRVDSDQQYPHHLAASTKITLAHTPND